MKFLDKLNKQWSLLDEADTVPASDEPKDAAAPDTNAVPAPEAGKTTEIAPEGYAGLVRILSKALAMSFPPEALDQIFKIKIDADNAIPMQTAIEAVIKQNEMYGDNPERLQNPNVKNYISSINPSNFINRYNHLLAAMKKQDPYIEDANI